MGRNKETMKRVLKFISPYKSKIIIMLLTALVTVGFTLYTPILIGNGVDNIVGPGNVNTAGLLKVLGALAVIVVGNAVSQWVMNLLTNQVTYSVVQDVRGQAFAHLQDPDGAGERRAAAAAGCARQPVRHGGEEPGGQHLRYDLLGGGQGDGPGQGWLRPYQVVRQPGVRAGHEGEGRRVQPLHAAEAVRHHRQVRGVRQGVHHRHLLGRGVLRRIKKEQSKGRLTQENMIFTNR